MRVVVAGAVAVLAVVPLAPVTAADPVVVRTRDQLVQALAAAVAGDTVYVDGAAVINLTGTKRIAIPAGVTLASNRGQGGAAGALLYNTELDRGERESWAQFVVRGSGARVTGLRLRGPDQEIRNDAYEFDNSDGIQAVDASDVTVDNNELWGWSHGAVYLVDTIEGRVSRNDIHHNRRTGLGYGVVLHNDSSAVIEFNTFRQNRHAIAASGIPTQRYDARFNLVVDNARSHGFDMHGENEALGNGAPYAGDVIHINRNSFRSAVEPAVAVRGRPATGAWVSHNCFAHGGAASAVVQRHFTGNLFVGTNTYSTTTANCHAAGSARPAAWQVSAGGTASWAPLAPYTFDVSEVGFGDFDGDGRTDVFSVLDGRWRCSSGGASSWRPLAASTVPVNALRFGDFDGDGRTDVFYVQNGRWFYSPGGAGSAVALASSGCPLSGLYVADFTGDGKADVFDGRCGT